MNAETATWHYGLVARYWNEFNVAEPAELAWYRAAIERHGQPALDAGCGTGRLLLPLLRAGLEVDGVDVSEDMLRLCAERARAEGLAPRLVAQPLHRLELDRRYRTVYLCGVFGIGGSRADDLEGLHGIHRALAPGGALMIEHELPYAGLDEERWARWLPGRRGDLPRPWPAAAERRRAADGDELELISRLAEFDPLALRHELELRVRLWRDGAVVEEEAPRRLVENLYFVPEIELMLRTAGFTEVEVTRRWSDEPAGPDDAGVMLVAIA